MNSLLILLRSFILQMINEILIKHLEMYMVNMLS